MSTVVVRLTALIFTPRMKAVRFSEQVNTCGKGLIGVPPFEVGGGHPPGTRVSPVWIVPGFDPIEHGKTGLARGSEGGPAQEFALERGEEALAEGIVIAVTDRAHAGPGVGFLVPFQGVLASLVPVVGDAAGSALLRSQFRGTEHQLRAEVTLRRAAHHAAARDVQSHRRIEESLPFRDESDVRHPEYVGSVGDKVATHEIRCGPGVWATPRRSSLSASADAPEPAACISRAPRLRSTPMRKPGRSAWIIGNPLARLGFVWTPRSSR